MATTLTYNGVVLYNAHTLEFSQTPQRDRSNTDQLFQRFRIRVRSLVNSAVNHVTTPMTQWTAAGATDIPNAAVGDTAQQLECKLRASLGQDRAPLLYQMEGITMIQSDKLTDADNGPKVLGLDVVRVSPLTLQVEFTIETALVICPNFAASTGKASPLNGEFPVTSNRWSCIDDLDDRFATTRTWQGLLRISTTTGGSVTPHAFRFVAVPPLSSGWKREKMQFVSDPDGLSLNYVITDREMVGPAAPFPAARMHFTHTETSGVGASESKQAAVPYAIGQCHVRLEGGRGADKRTMFGWGFQIIATKLQITEDQSTYSILELALSDTQGQDINVVEMQARVAHIPPANSSLAANYIATMALATMGLPLTLQPQMDSFQKAIAYDPNQSILLDAYGTATLATLFACQLQTPCGVSHYMSDQSDNADGDNTDAAPGDTSPSVPAVTPSEQPIITNAVGPVSESLASPPGYSLDQQTAIYSFYQIDSIIKRDKHRVGLPISTTSGSTPGPTSPTVKVCTLAMTGSIRTVRIHGERLGQWPVMLTDDDFKDGNGIMNFNLESHLNARAPILSNNGKTYYYGYDQELVYQMERPTRNGYEPLPVGALPWSSDLPNDNKIPLSTFRTPDDPNNGLG